MTHNFIKLILLNSLIIIIRCQILNNTHSFSTLALEIPAGNCDQMEKNISLKLLTRKVLNKIIINNGFMESSSLNCLDMEENQVTEISPAAFKFLPNLYFLNLARNFIPTTNLFSINDHQKLETLILDENVPDKKNYNLTIKAYFPNLKNLYLRKNEIQIVNLDLEKNLPNLTHLYLSENKIESIKVSSLTLTHFYLEKNLIKNFNASMIKNVEVLILDDNKIEIVCNTYCHEFSLCLNNAKNIKYLSLSENKVIEIESDSFDDTINLISLDLSKNKIETIRKGTFTFLRNLQNLSISNNYLKTFPNVSTLINLQILNLSDNKLEIVQTGEFKNLYLLKKLVLSNNLLKNVKVESFGNLISLEELDLSNNKLNHLPENWLSASENLRILDLKGNCFTDIKSLSLENVESLKIIFLQKNPLKYVNTGSMINLPKNVSIFLDNEYRADCLRNLESNLKSHVSIIKRLLTNKTPNVERIN